MTRALVLTAPAPLSDADAARAFAAAGCAAWRRLAPEAAEAEALDADRARLEAARAALAEAAVDANLVPVEGRHKRLLLADMDSTIITVECIDEIADFAGVKPQVAAVTEAAMRGELDFDGALTERVALLAGLPEAALGQVWRERVRLSPGAATLVRTLGALGVETALVSGGFTFFTERVADAAGFASHRANRLEVAEGRLTGRVIPPILGREAKRERLAALCAELAIAPAQAVAIGDGANDLAMVEAAGLGVAYRAKPALAEAADARLDHSDLSALLHLMGVAPERWVRA
ncbi:MAG: phosphoserine phosphatase SerB [Rubrimonas sp.]|uniref:phosphoserine phosphatase SerB n=1 Tax=Rubrimonas sp. TaxID=2036015 RepID=UPI002FDE0DCC